jgi:hypothetical protein
MIEFLNPFVWALSLSLIPVLIYLYRFYSRKKYVFPTVKFVSANDKTRWLNINVELLKLFLRVLIVATIVLIFSSPIISTKKEDNVIFFIDNSYSSRYNFDSYLSYLRKTLKEYPSNTKVFVIDNSGNLISGSPKEVIEKLKYYYPEIREYNKGALRGFLGTSLLSTAPGSRIIFLTDGQRSFWDFVRSLGVKDYESVIFPSFSLDARAYIRVWNRLTRDVEGEVEVYSKSNCSVEVVLSNASGERIIMSSQVMGKKNFFIKFTNPFEGISILKVLLFRYTGTNEFFVPITSVSKISLNVPEEEKKFFLSSLYSLGFTNSVDKGNDFSISILGSGNLSSFRNSIIIPKSPDARFLYKGKFITFYTNSIGDYVKSVNYTFHSLPIANKLFPSFVPDGTWIVKLGSTAVGLYFEDENNLLVFGNLNFYDSSLPIFLKEAFEFLLVDSKFVTNKSITNTSITNTSLYNYDGTFSMIPEEEISDVESLREMSTTRSASFNFISLLLFVFLCVFMVIERYV